MTGKAEFIAEMMYSHVRDDVFTYTYLILPTLHRPSKKHTPQKHNHLRMHSRRQIGLSTMSLAISYGSAITLCSTYVLVFLNVPYLVSPAA
jgi:hypothetical protein